MRKGINMETIVLWAGFIYGIIALVVKTFPTVPAKYAWLLTLIKFLGVISNRQTDDDAIRAAQK